MRPIPDKAVDFISSHEGCELKAYQDIAGVWTIGYGHTGPDVTPNMTITKARAKVLLKQDLGVAAGRIAARVNGPVLAELNDSQYSALLSFVFNLGANPSWTIWRVINSRNFDQVPAQIIRFNKARVNGQLRVVRGLATRRSAEADMWNDDAEDVRVSGRNVETPPVDNNAKPLMQSKTLISGATSAVAAGSAGVIQLKDAIAPHSWGNETLMNFVGILSMIAAGLAVAIVVFKWLDHKNAKK